MLWLRQWILQEALENSKREITAALMKSYPQLLRKYIADKVKISPLVEIVLLLKLEMYSLKRQEQVMNFFCVVYIFTIFTSILILNQFEITSLNFWTWPKTIWTNWFVSRNPLWRWFFATINGRAHTHSHFEVWEVISNWTKIQDELGLFPLFTVIGLKG